MLDVHPPHEPTHTWKDFLIHIATIVLGLMIAVGLEQAVEYVHHRYEVRETREALRRELEDNQRRMKREVVYWRKETAALENNLLVLEYLKQHPGTPQEKLPGILIWSDLSAGYTHVAWDAAKQNAVIDLLPEDEAARDAERYERLARVDSSSEDVWTALNDASQFSYVDGDLSHLSPQQVDETITLLAAALKKQFLAGVPLENLGRHDPVFAPTLSLDEIHRLEHRPNLENPTAMAAATALSMRRIQEAVPEKK